MRPSSHSSSSFVPTYADERDKQIKNWLSEQEDLLAKIKGSSLKQADKDEALKQLLIQISKNLES